MAMPPVAHFTLVGAFWPGANMRVLARSATALPFEYLNASVVLHDFQCISIHSICDRLQLLFDFSNFAAELTDLCS
jgi:hypothetical protein